MSSVIEIEDLHKSYRQLRRPPRVAIDGLDLTVPQGCVTDVLASGAQRSPRATTNLRLVSLARR